MNALSLDARQPDGLPAQAARCGLALLAFRLPRKPDAGIAQPQPQQRRRRKRSRPWRCRASGIRGGGPSGPTPRASPQIRFLTEIDYPPFNYAGPDGNPAGFNVDLARLICEELKIACTIQMRRFDTLLPALAENRGDAVIASIAVTPETRQARRFQRSLLSHAGALRGAARERRSTMCVPETARGQEGRGGRRHRA